MKIGIIGFGIMGEDCVNIYHALKISLMYILKQGKIKSLTKLYFKKIKEIVGY